MLYNMKKAFKRLMLRFNLDKVLWKEINVLDYILHKKLGGACLNCIYYSKLLVNPNLFYLLVCMICVQYRHV